MYLFQNTLLPFASAINILADISPLHLFLIHVSVAPENIIISITLSYTTIWIMPCYIIDWLSETINIILLYFIVAHYSCTNACFYHNFEVLSPHRLSFWSSVSRKWHHIFGIGYYHWIIWNLLILLFMSGNHEICHVPYL